jgi:predicted DNA-binding transcriptional regulator AlpA
VLTQRAFKAKGLDYSRQHIDRKVREGTFPVPFQLPSNSIPGETSS